MPRPSSLRELPGAVIVAHGSPSDPEPQERFIRRLAERVAARVARDVRGATLAKPGALEAAVAGLERPLIFPHFMSDGWFVSKNLPDRLKRAGLANWRMLPPLGLDTALPALALRRLADVVAEHRFFPAETTLIVAAHGSPSDPRPAQATERFGRLLEQGGGFAEVRLGYVDEAPSLETAGDIEGPGIVLPFFAARAGHVLNDLPEALEAAKFSGPTLPPIGTWDAIPLLIAKALSRSERGGI